MRYIYFTKTLQKLDVPSLIKFCKEAGLDGADMAVRPGFPVTPDNAKALSYALCGADTAALVVDKLSAQVGEQILGADAIGLAHGIIVLQNYLQPEQLKPLLKGTTLEAWPILTEEDWPKVRAHLATSPKRPDGGFVMVPIDHHFNVNRRRRRRLGRRRRNRTGQRRSHNFNRHRFFRQRHGRA